MTSTDHDPPCRVAVIGACGRMGSEACRAVEAATDLELVAALGRDDELSTITDAGAQVAVDLTVPSVTAQTTSGGSSSTASMQWSAPRDGPTTTLERPALAARRAEGWAC